MLGEQKGSVIRDEMLRFRPERLGRWEGGGGRWAMALFIVRMCVDK